MAVKETEKTSRQLEEIFANTFLAGFNTMLAGGADEPVYLPADEHHPHHRILYREDYFSSALHEIAHWCVAGAARRRLVDFGYWYNPDGRTGAQQRAFENVEIKPQALEWVFSTAAGIRFVVSADNLSADDPQATGPSQEFLLGLEAQALAWCEQGLPDRAASFTAALAAFYGIANPLNPENYRGRYSC